MIQKLLQNIQMIWMMFINETQEYNPHKKRKILIVFDDMIADMLSNKKLNSIVTESFIRGRRLNIALIFILQSYFSVAHYFVMTIPNKRQLQQSFFNLSLDTDFQDFINLFKKSTA